MSLPVEWAGNWSSYIVHMLVRPVVKANPLLPSKSPMIYPQNQCLTRQPDQNVRCQSCCQSRKMAPGEEHESLGGPWVAHDTPDGPWVCSKRPEQDGLHPRHIQGLKYLTRYPKANLLSECKAPYAIEKTHEVRVEKRGLENKVSSGIQHSMNEITYSVDQDATPFGVQLSECTAK